MPVICIDCVHSKAANLERRAKIYGRAKKIDCLDLLQHHEIIRFDDDHRIFDPEGANATFASRTCLTGSKQ